MDKLKKCNFSLSKLSGLQLPKEVIHKETVGCLYKIKDTDKIVHKLKVKIQHQFPKKIQLLEQIHMQFQKNHKEKIAAIQLLIIIRKIKGMILL